MAADSSSRDTIFCAAIEIASADDRAAYIARECGGDAALRAEVHKLVEAHFRAGNFLEGPAHDPRATSADDSVSPKASGTEQPGLVLAGRYKLLEKISAGGMGTVWMAQQTEPVKRLVAVKLIKTGMDSKTVLARFEVERQAVALMDHPNIAKVLDAGESDGRPFFVMELVKGVPITRYCDEQHLTLGQRLELFVPVCQAIQHAHHKGIIHRDIKPRNVLVACYDDRPVPKVIDFGVAKATGQQLTEQTLHTGFGAVVGTVEYMSPEQASFNQLDVDTRSDVYALGVLLYELLAGSPPFARKELEKAGLLEILRLIREQEPTKPSTRLSTADGLPALAANRGTEPKKLSGLVRGELDWIVMKALEKDRSRRYETANGFAMDVQRYLADEPVLACPASAMYRFRKFARRNKAALVTGAVVALAVLAAVVVLVISNVSITREKRQKEIALQEAEANLLLAREAVDEIYKPVAAQLNILPHMQPFQREVLQKALRFYREFAQRKSSDPTILLETAQAALHVVQIQLTLGQRGQHEQACREAIAALEQLADELPSEPNRRLALGKAHYLLGSIHSETGRHQEAEQNQRQALTLYRELVAERSDVPDYRLQLAGACNTLGGVLQDRPREAEQRHREAIRLCEQLVTGRPDEPLYRGQLLHSYYMLGCLLASTHRVPEAEEALRQAIAVFDKARQQMSRSCYRSLLPSIQHSLGNVLATGGRAKEAETAYRQAIGLAERHVSQFPDIRFYRQCLAEYYLSLAKLLVKEGRSDEAAPFGRAWVKLAKELLAESTDDTQPREQSLAHLITWGTTLRDAGELQGAEQALRKAVELAKKLAADSPKEPSHRQRLAESQYALGAVLKRARRFREAADAFRENLAVFEKLAAEFPADPEYRVRQASAGNLLGILLRGLPKEAETAVQHHHQAIKVCDQLVDQFPEQPRYWQELVRSHFGLGLALSRSGRWAEVEAAFQQAIAAAGPLRDQPPHRDNSPSDLHNALAWLLATCPDGKVRDPKRAVEFARKAIKLNPQASFWNTLGVAHYRAGNYKEALVALEKSMELGKGGVSFDWIFLAMAHWQLGKKDKARQWYDKAVQWMEKNNPKDEELRRFRAEAAALLKIAGKRNEKPE